MTANVEHELWKQFEQATSARDRAELSEAIRLLREILAMAPPGERKLITATNQQLGYIAGSLETPNNPVAAVGYFAKAAELSPRSELSSLGLFHALDAAGRLGADLILTRGSWEFRTDPRGWWRHDDHLDHVGPFGTSVTPVA
jgi:hypothetical protein